MEGKEEIVQNNINISHLYLFKLIYVYISLFVI